MIKSMTGYALQERDIPPFGRVRVEMRSSNHKYLETVFRLPDGFLALEDKLKKKIESKIKRGRVVCNIYATGTQASRVFINKKLAHRYLEASKDMRNTFHVRDPLSLDTLINLPGVVSLASTDVRVLHIWPKLSLVLEKTLMRLMRARQKEGRALASYLKHRASSIRINLERVENRYKKSAEMKLRDLKTPDERAGFLKDSDIAEEVQRLKFHVKNFNHKLQSPAPVGKELDFIAQEMQREANTIGAKSFDSIISAKVVYIKSQIEKIREQVQNIE